MKNSESSCSIHGVNYIFGANRNKLVRIFWIFPFVLSLCGFGYYVHTSYYKWFILPDITARIHERIVYDFPRPAVTICPRMVSKNDLADLDETFFEPKARNKSECEYLLANSYWCSSDKTLSNLQSHCEKWFDDLNMVNVLDLINRSALSTREIFQKKFSLVRTFTHQGICFSINMQDFKVIFNEDVIHSDFQSYHNHDHPENEWNAQDGYFDKTSNYPERSYAHAAFEIEMNLTTEDADNACNSRSMFAIIHLPSEIPTEFHKFLPIRYGSKSSIIVATYSFRTDNALRDYSEDVRRCYFRGERKLEFFKTYSKAQCMLECAASDILRKCYCVPFWYPRNQTTPVCELSQMKCVHVLSDSYRIEGKPSCRCFPSCNTIRYHVESTPNNFFHSALPNLNGTMIEIVHLSGVAEEVEHFSHYKLQDLISDVGGLLGLFLGCSLLSIVEIFYYLAAALKNLVKRRNQVEEPQITQIDLNVQQAIKDLLKKEMETFSVEIQDNLNGMKLNFDFLTQKVKIIAVNVENASQKIENVSLKVDILEKNAVVFDLD